MNVQRPVALLIAAALVASAPTGLAAQQPRVELEESPGSRSVVESPCEECSHGMLGVALAAMTPELREHLGAPADRGVLVSRVTAGSAAERGGLRVGDVITAVDSRDVDSSRDLERRVRSAAGETLVIELYRQGRRLELEATPDERREHRRYERRVHRSDRHHDADFDLGGLAAEMAALGVEMGALGAEIGLSVAEAMAAVDWEGIGESVEHSIEHSLEAVDWDEIGEEIERSMRSLDGLEIEVDSRELERALEKLERALEDLELEISVNRD